MRKLSTLSGKVKKNPSTQANPDRYEFLDLQNAEPDLGVAAGNDYVLTSDTAGNRTWVSQVDIVTNNVDQTYVNDLNIDAATLDGQNGIYYLDWLNVINKPDPNVKVNLSGDIVGSGNTTLTDLTDGVINITAELSNTGVFANTYGSTSKVPQFTVDEDGRITNVTDLDVVGVSSLNYNSANGTITIGTPDGSFFSSNIDLQAFDTDDLLEGLNNQYFTVARANTAIDNKVTKTFVDNLNVNADQLDGQDGAYYVNFNNFVNLPDPKIDVVLSGDVTGSANTTLTNLGDGIIEIAVSVIDDSHNHTIANIDNLQNALDGKLEADANAILTELLTVDGGGSNLDADLLDGQHGSYYLNWTNTVNKPDPSIDLALTGDVSGSGTVILNDLTSGNLSIITTVADDSHNHTISNIDGLQLLLDGKTDDSITITAGPGLIGGGDLSADRTISHADTSLQANTNNTNGNVIQNVEVDTFGHITSLTSANLDNRYVNTSGDTLTGFLTLHADPTSALHAATKEYVDTIAAASLHYHDPVRVESPVNLSATYDNGASGVGATLTGQNEVLVIDGITLDLNDRVLIYKQTNAAHNGVYKVTQLGADGTTPWILTRTSDTDSYNASDPSSLGQGDAFFVLEGNTGAGELYVMTTEGAITFGTTAIIFSQISSTQIYSAGSGIELNGTTFSHTDTSSQNDIGPLTGGNVISEVDLDDFGHIIGLSTRSLTLNDLGFTGDVDSDNYIGWNLLVDNVLRDQITANENVNFVGGPNINLTYSSANNTVTFEGTNTLANDATITLSAGTGLSGGGNFTTDQSGNETITFSHADTSSQANTNNTTGTVIQNVEVDTYGHITSLSSTTLTTTVIGEGTNQYYTAARANSAIDARVTQSFVNALNVDADTLDGVQGSSFLRSDATDTATGTLTFTGTVNLDGLVEIDSTYILGADSATTTSTSTTLISSFATTTYSSGKFVIQASDAVSGEVHVTELLVVHNGVTASAVEYGTIFTGAGVLATYDVDIATGNVRILATPASSNSTTFKVTESLITG